jgi:hypothetical protein
MSQADSRVAVRPGHETDQPEQQRVPEAHLEVASDAIQQEYDASDGLRRGDVAIKQLA